MKATAMLYARTGSTSGTIDYSFSRPLLHHIVSSASSSYPNPFANLYSLRITQAEVEHIWVLSKLYFLSARASFGLG